MNRIKLTCGIQLSLSNRLYKLLADGTRMVYFYQVSPFFKSININCLNLIRSFSIRYFTHEFGWTMFKIYFIQRKFQSISRKNEFCVIQPINELVKRSRREWDQHVTRMGAERLVKISRDDILVGRIFPGHPKRRQTDLIIDWNRRNNAYKEEVEEEV